MTNVKVEHKEDLTDEEIQAELDAADQIENPYFRLRAKATVSLLETGKRRMELATLKTSDIYTDNEFLYVRFTVVKKRKKNARILQRTKKYQVTSPHAQNILAYRDWLKQHEPSCEWLYPSGHMAFGNYIITPATHLDPQAIWRIIKTLNMKDWPHLHRERRAVKRIRADERKYGEAKIETVYAVRRILDLEREETAWNYIRRHETQRVEDQEEIE